MTSCPNASRHRATHSLSVEASGEAIVHAIETVFDPKSGAPRTPDIGGKATTSDLGKAIAEAL
jgi:tartrate dehydrogenase/decarboxylase/D-malate dehydrogenase